jgi:2-polyprenyl-6-methoxyphenol hydroxylase-like FAD-dependent oxidoreductase
MRVIIVGSGIAGLSTAIALRKVGVDVAVYERAPELREVGAGISLWFNALRALEYLGAADSVRAVSLQCQRSEMRAQNGFRTLAAIDTAAIAKELRVPELISMTHRADLVSALASHLPVGIAKYGHECAAVENTATGATIRFTNGHTDTADAIIGADGIHSVVRTAIHGAQPPRYSGYTCWRGICPRPATIEPGYIGEWYGRGKRFGITTIPHDRVYWFAGKNAPPNGRELNEGEFLAREFAGWASPVEEMIASTPPQQILRNDIIDRVPVRVWSKGRIAVIGDAAHPTTPNLGQGGCSAIEDAVAIARSLVTHGSVPDAFAAFTKERYARTAGIVNDSWRFGKLAQKESRLGCWIRDNALRLMLKVMGTSELLKYAKYDVGPLPQKS